MPDTISGPTAIVDKSLNTQYGNRDASISLDEQSRHRLIVEWNDTASDFPRTRCVHELVADQATKTPATIALVGGDQSLTYGELDGRANQVANYLQSVGIGAESVVGLCIERSCEMAIGILGICKAGAAYLPLDGNYPAEHIGYVLKDANVSMVLTSVQTKPMFSSHRVRTIEIKFDCGLIADQPKSPATSIATADNLAYVMYTSGSSGKPKGVGVVHSNISRLVLGSNYVQISADDVFLQFAPVTFDAATFEIWGALLNGAKLILYPSEPMLDLQKLKAVIQNSGVSIMWLTAGLFHRIVDGDLQILSPLKQLLAGGDMIYARQVKRVLEEIKDCRVKNGYGPTEGTTFSVCYPVADSSAIGTTVPIGRPVSNTTVYVLDAQGEPVPVEEAGELYIGGAGLARGYFGWPELTAESFVPNGFDVCGSRLYRTGDVVRYSDEGLLKFVGRMDFQVKIRGYRVELEEIEAALLLYPGVQQAAVAALPDVMGDKRLLAYIVGVNGSASDGKKLREHLSQHLPQYMIPSVFVALKTLPLTANGKVDRRALPTPELGVDSEASQDPVEQLVAEIWATTLGVSRVGLNDDFFDLGGTSLSLINIVLEISKKFALPLDTSIVAGGATVSALARAVRTRTNIPGLSSQTCAVA